MTVPTPRPDDATDLASPTGPASTAVMTPVPEDGPAEHNVSPHAASLGDIQAEGDLGGAEEEGPGPDRGPSSRRWRTSHGSTDAGSEPPVDGPNRIPNEVIDGELSAVPGVAAVRRLTQRMLHMSMWRDPSKPFMRQHIPLRPASFVLLAAIVVPLTLFIALIAELITLPQAGMLLVAAFLATVVGLLVAALAIAAHIVVVSANAERIMRRADEQVRRHHEWHRSLYRTMRINTPWQVASLYRTLAKSPHVTAWQKGVLMHCAYLSDPTGRLAPMPAPPEGDTPGQHQEQQSQAERPASPRQRRPSRRSRRVPADAPVDVGEQARGEPDTGIDRCAELDALNPDVEETRRNEPAAEHVRPDRADDGDGHQPAIAADRAGTTAGEVPGDPRADRGDAAESDGNRRVDDVHRDPSGESGPRPMATSVELPAARTPDGPADAAG